MRFECVCKQWKRTIFNRQYVIDMDNMLAFKLLSLKLSLNRQSKQYVIDSAVCYVQSVMRKCPAIRYLIFGDSYWGCLHGMTGYLPNYIPVGEFSLQSICYL
jgi:hypothetical protein